MKENLPPWRVPHDCRGGFQTPILRSQGTRIAAVTFLPLRMMAEPIPGLNEGHMTAETRDWLTSRMTSCTLETEGPPGEVSRFSFFPFLTTLSSHGVSPGNITR
ncbi:hypothetical protein GDO81_021083 [Engystomops pustulosus]|uniref:Uncharacterized protein n=1 Tax=Engystomops pustulosus TaxID=76066 RepID=A0AAV6YZ94_ENGPU|nr:hypothetical protein GDO81_021083 [Engystomops pustulosus]